MHHARFLLSFRFQLKSTLSLTARRHGSINGSAKKISSSLCFPEKIGSAVFNTLCSTGTRLWNVEEEADKLRRTEGRIRAPLTDAEKRRFVDHGSVRLWLQELRAAAFDVDTLLDRLNTMTAVSRTVSAEPSRKRKRPWLDVQLGLRQCWELNARITKINERLDEIAKGGKTTGYRTRTQGGRLNRNNGQGFLKLLRVVMRDP